MHGCSLRSGVELGSNAEYTPLLRGIGFAGYRSFATWQEFLFPTKVTVLAGINNSGKSNVLRFLQAVMPTLASGRTLNQPGPRRPELDDLDRPRGFKRTSTLEVGVPVRLGTLGERQDLAKSQGRIRTRSLVNFQEGVMSLLRGDDGEFWSRYALVDGKLVPVPSHVEQAVSRWPNWNQNFRGALDLLGGTVNPKEVMQRILTSIGGFSSLPAVVTITSARRVEATDEVEPDWLSGRGIIRALASIQNPPHDKWDDSQPRWAAINRFVRVVLGDSDASLNVPYDFSTIQVETPQRVLPLSSLGGGVEQVIVLAAAATVTTGSLVCVEEPETNLHPLLQKKLVRYLTNETDNQYVIATHSSHLLDDERATAYHVRLTTGGSVAHLARRPHELVEICHDLGYRPSDLLQANCVIWVEGPSDRVYIHHWLELLDPTLTEGIDYSLMFYGGKLLAHLSASEEALAEFISLRRLNRASAVLIDSDKTGSNKRLNATKTRIRDEFAADHPAPGFAWVTKCYTIENYIPADILRAAVKQVHPYVDHEPAGQWQNPLPSKKDGTTLDKVGIAAAVVPMLESKHLDVLDLRKQVTALRNFVRAANGHSVAPDLVGETG